MQQSTVRHFVAVKDGKVVGSRSTHHAYRWCVVWKLLRADPIKRLEWFATFHSQLRGAQLAHDQLFLNYPTRELLETRETAERVPVGEVWRDELEVQDDSEPDAEDVTGEEARRQAELLESCWRNS